MPHPAALPGEKRPGTHRTECWMEGRTDLDGCRKSRPHRDCIPGPSSPRRVAIGTTLSRPIGHHLKFPYLCRQIVDVRKTVLTLVAFQGTDYDLPIRKITAKP